MNLSKKRYFHVQEINFSLRVLSSLEIGVNRKEILEVILRIHRI